jgi:hypothetical protein
MCDPDPQSANRSREIKIVRWTEELSSFSFLGQVGVIVPRFNGFNGLVNIRRAFFAN